MQKLNPTFWPDQIDAHRLLAQVGSGRATASYESNQVIFKQGEQADAILFVQQGRVKITVPSEQGLEVVLGVAEEGQFFGETCLHNVPVRLATATAVIACRITSVTKVAILSAIRDRPRFARLFADYVAGHSWLQGGSVDHPFDPKGVPVSISTSDATSLGSDKQAPLSSSDQETV